MALRAPQPPTTHTTRVLDGAANGSPENVVDDVAELLYGQHGGNHDQRHEHRVLQQILPFICPRELTDGGNETCHGRKTCHGSTIESGAPRDSRLVKG